MSEAVLVNTSAVLGTDAVGLYEVGPLLAVDDLSSLRLAVHTGSGDLFAIRSFGVTLADDDDDGRSADDGADKGHTAAAFASRSSVAWLSSKEFLQHMVSVRRLSHAHVQPCVDILRSPAWFHLVYPFAQGGTVMNALRERVQNARRRSEELLGSKILPGKPNAQREAAASSEAAATWFSDSKYSEDEGRFYFQQLVSALRYAHEREHLIHGALSTDCLWLDAALPFDAASATIDRASYAQRPKLRVADFGVAAMRAHSRLSGGLFSSELLRELVAGDGSSSDAAVQRLEAIIQQMAFIAPELLVPSWESGPGVSGGKTIVPLGDDAIRKCDVWSCGVILYTMLVGATPFPLIPSESVDTVGGSGHVAGQLDDDLDETSTAGEEYSGTKASIFAVEDPATILSSVNALRHHIGDFFRRMQHAVFPFPQHLSRGVRGVRHLIALMLEPDPQRRITFDQVVAHHWFDVRVEKSLFPDKFGTATTTTAAGMPIASSSPSAAAPSAGKTMTSATATSASAPA